MADLKKKEADRKLALKRVANIKAGGEDWWLYRSNAVNATAQRRGHARYVTPDDLKAIVRRDGMSCRYCGKILILGTNPGRSRESLILGFDHVIPGVETVENMVVCCAACNHLKRDLNLEAIERFRAVMVAYI